MTKSVLTPQLFTAMILAAILSVWSSCTSEAWEKVSSGWIATEPGYFFTDAYAARVRDSLDGFMRRSEHWHGKYTESRDDALTEVDIQQRQVEGLVGYMTTERDASDKAIEIAARRKTWGCGFFAGVGVNQHGFGPTFGFGLYWEVW